MYICLNMQIEIQQSWLILHAVSPQHVAYNQNTY